MWPSFQFTAKRLLGAYQLQDIPKLRHEMCNLNDVTNTAYIMGCKIKESVCDYPQGQAIFIVSLMPRLAHSTNPSPPLLSSQLVPRTFSENKT